MKLHLMSYNVRGLNEVGRIDRLKYFISQVSPRLDCLMIQEHRLRHDAARNVGRTLWRGAKTWCLEATHGYTIAGLGAGKGGVVTLLAPKWVSMITQQGSIMNNRVHWFILGGLPGGEVGFANIYAPNSAHERCVLWELLIATLPRTCRWVLAGDFNNVETRQDKSKTCGRLIPNMERRLFNTMKEILQVTDNPRDVGSLQYSWDNARQDGSRVLA